MAIDRRNFLGATLSVGTIALATGCGNGEEHVTPPAKASDQANRESVARTDGFTLQMRFTGLFLFEVMADKSEMLVSFIDEKKVGVHETHVNLMLLNLKDQVFKWPDEYSTHNITAAAPDGLPLRPPQIVRVGSEVYGMWGLDDRVVWVKSAHDKFYSDDPAPAFTFPSDQGKWKGLDQFLNMKTVLAPAGASAATIASTEVPALKAERVKSRIRLTRGTAVGEEPFSRCERERQYGIIKNNQPPTEFKTYAAEFTVSYFIKGTEAVLGVSGRGRTEVGGRDELEYGHAVITLRGKPGSTVALAFSNCPVTHYHRAEHFSAVSRVLGVDESPRVVEIIEANNCTSGLVSPYGMPADVRTELIKSMPATELAAIRKEQGKGDFIFGATPDDGFFIPTPPDPGCVPGFIARPGEDS